MVLGVDSEQEAHRHAVELAREASEEGFSVALIQANRDQREVKIVSGPELPASVIRVLIPDLARAEVADIAAKLVGVVDRVMISGPFAALSQLSLEYATTAAKALIVGGMPSQVERLITILDQLGIDHQRVALSRLEQSPNSQLHRQIRPPGRLL